VLRAIFVARPQPNSRRGRQRNFAARTRSADRTRFVEGSALDLPFEDASFDAATLFHVGMNIADKARLFAEARHTLRRGGTFAVYEVMRKGQGPLPFLLPWADSEATSFVETHDTYRALLAAAGFSITGELEHTALVLDLAAKMRERIAAEGPPKL
jgi:ubiquinone/menaquinone biosynthesis C-methylase UbiE